VSSARKMFAFALLPNAVTPRFNDGIRWAVKVPVAWTPGAALRLRAARLSVRHSTRPLECTHACLRC
jgi:hypothetical protein